MKSWLLVVLSKPIESDLEFIVPEMGLNNILYNIDIIQSNI